MLQFATLIDITIVYLAEKYFDDSFKYSNESVNND